MSLSEKRFEKLTAFKEFMNKDYVTLCKKQFGKDVYEQFVAPYIDDLLESIEMHLEDLAEQSIQDEDYDDNFDEDEENE